MCAYVFCFSIKLHKTLCEIEMLCFAHLIRLLSITFIELFFWEAHSMEIGLAEKKVCHRIMQRRKEKAEAIPKINTNLTDVCILGFDSFVLPPPPSSTPF